MVSWTSTSALLVAVVNLIDAARLLEISNQLPRFAMAAPLARFFLDSTDDFVVGLRRGIMCGSDNLGLKRVLVEHIVAGIAGNVRCSVVVTVANTIASVGVVVVVYGV